MSYQKVDSFCIVCDNCGETYCDDHSGFTIFVDEIQANDYAQNSDWYNEGDKHYCDNCHSFDEDDNLIIKAKKNEQ